MESSTPPANVYTQLWFTTFLRTYGPDFTARELVFLARQLPLPRFHTVLDLCCANGRIALPLAERGHAVTGVDRDAAQLAQAREASAQAGVTTVRYVEADMRRLDTINGPFDAVLSMWASFGYFDDATNAALLGDLANLLTRGGRMVLDVYHRDFFTSRQGTLISAREGEQITTTQRLDGNRLTTCITYGSTGTVESFSWQVFTPDELSALGATCGLRTALACTGFDEDQPATEAQPRMQLVFERL
jgi:SAM-dependent methyltransferase